MTKIAVAPYVMKTVVFKIGQDEYQAHCSKVEYVPSTQKQSWRGLDGNSHTSQGVAEWTLNLDFAQDWVTQNSLAQFLLEHDGQEASVTVQPLAGAGKTFESTVTCTPGKIGGQEGEFATASVSLGSTKPTVSTVGG